ncbi:MAG: glycosyltransferase family 4 protein [Pseudomonadota bacterium]
MTDSRPGFLLVANWPSDVGFAWWLMESYWAALANHYHPDYRMVLAFPKINEIPTVIREAPIDTVEYAFGRNAIELDLQFLQQHRIREIYFSDRPNIDARYLRYRRAGVEHIITHDHTPGLRTPPTGIKRILKRVRARIPGLVCDAAIGATEFVRQRTIDTNLLPAEKCFAVPNGLPAAQALAPRNPVEEFALDPDAVHMVMTARANPYKGLRFVLDCLARFRRTESIDLQFTLLGDGPMLNELMTLAADHDITDACHFPGYVDGVSALLPGFDFAIHPSKGEVGYSLAILEYMRAGLATLVPNNPSVCGATAHGQTGLIFREGDQDACIAAMKAMACDPAYRSELGEAARIDEKRYSLANAHKRLLEIVEMTLSR